MRDEGRCRKWWANADQFKVTQRQSEFMYCTMGWVWPDKMSQVKSGGWAATAVAGEDVVQMQQR